jgi:hypothetical protein
MIPSTQYSGKVETTETVNRKWFTGFKVKGMMTRESTADFRTMKLLFTILYW